MKTVFFDDSLPCLVKSISMTLGAPELEKGVVIRDAVGQLSFVCALCPDNPADRTKAHEALKESLGSYARPSQALRFADEPGAATLLASQDFFTVSIQGLSCRIIDRRIVGVEWLSRPLWQWKKPIRIVFASLKGGVGRSTALTVAAYDLAARGQNVLVIDLDLEAPGIGEYLLGIERTPLFGVTDYLVENGVGGVPGEHLGDFVGVSSLTSTGGGRVDVIPAFGTLSIKEPANVLPKLARAMVEDVNEKGIVTPVGAQIAEMIERFSSRQSYDAILIDSRAGLSELAAPAVLALQAVVLLFGTAQRQTINGYRSLFAAFKLLAERSNTKFETADWRRMFRPVYAKASLDRKIASEHADNLYELFADYLYDKDMGDEANSSDLNYSADDPDAPHKLLVIPFEPRFIDFEPSLKSDQINREFYELTFRPFLNSLDRIIADHNELAEQGLS